MIKPAHHHYHHHYHAPISLSPESIVTIYQLSIITIAIITAIHYRPDCHHHHCHHYHHYQIKILPVYSLHTDQRRSEIRPNPISNKCS